MEYSTGHPMSQRSLASVLILGFFFGALPALGADESDKFVGTWKTSEPFAGYDLRTTIATGRGQWSIQGTYEKDAAVAGTFVGERVRLADGALTYWFKHVKKPEGTWLDRDTMLRLDGDALVMSWVAKNGREIVRRCQRVPGEPMVAVKTPATEPARPKLPATAKGETPKSAKTPQVVGKDTGTAAAAQPAAAPPADRPRRNDGNYVGLWTGAFSGTSERLSLNVVQENNQWTVEGFVTSAENKRLAYFKHVGATLDAEGKSLSCTLTWVEKAAPIAGEPTLTLTPEPPALRAELADSKMASKVTIDLTASNPRLYAKLKPPSDQPGRPVRPARPAEAFKLPPQTPPAKPFAELDVKQHIVATAVSPDGKRVALGSQKDLNNALTADLSVWDIGRQKQVWIKKQLVADKNFGMVRAVAFSSDGKILAAQPRTAAGEESLQFFDAETGAELRSPAPLKMHVDRLAFHPTKRLFAIGAGGRLELIDLRTGKPLWATPQIHRVSIDGLVFSPSGETIATVGWTLDGKGYCVLLFDAAKGTLIHDFGATQGGVAAGVVFSGDGQRLAAYFGDLDKPGISIWDVESKELTLRIPGVVPGGDSFSPHELAFLADNKTLAAAVADYHLHLFDVTTGQRVGIYPRAFRIQCSDVFAVADGHLLTYNRSDWLVQLWKQSDALPPPTR